MILRFASEAVTPARADEALDSSHVMTRMPMPRA